jgi:Hypothetical glycosyl hydrolase family 15
MSTAGCASILSLVLVGGVGCGSSPVEAPARIADDAGIGADSAPADVSAETAMPLDGPLPNNPSDGAGGDSSGDAAPSGRAFPDTSSRISVLADQLPSMSSAQQQFAASHYVGTQKQLIGETRALRALNPNFIVLHYHLAMWQSAPAVDFIVDGRSWGNDYPTVTTHEDWFWHNTASQRVPSGADGKLLMNVSSAPFQAYWADSLAGQVKAGEYDAVFLDSASPALLQAECSAIDPRLAATAARNATFAELGNATWIGAWQAWIAALAGKLQSQGIPLIPNTGAFVTGWDNTNYGLTAGIFSEGFAGTGFAEGDWQASTNELLALAAADKIMILQNYLSASSDVPTRLYYLGNYLLVKGSHTYIDYFASNPLEWYPEWELDLGAPATPPPAQVAALRAGGVYRRDFARGSVLVNPSASPVTVQLGQTVQQVVPNGGGTVDAAGSVGGSLTQTPVTSVVVGATSAAIVLL